MNLDVHVLRPRIMKDHDPKPFCRTFHAELPGRFSWTYLEQGPEIWRVRIGKAARSARSASGSGARC